MGYAEGKRKARLKGSRFVSGCGTRGCMDERERREREREREQRYQINDGGRVVGTCEGGRDT